MLKIHKVELYQSQELMRYIWSQLSFQSWKRKCLFLELKLPDKHLMASHMVEDVFSFTIVV